MRPFLVTLVAILVLTITGLHLVRLIQTLSWWDFLSNLPSISPVYLALTGLFWTLAGLPIFLGLWLGWPGVPKAARLLAVAYALYVWLDRLLVAEVENVMVNLPFAAGLTALLLFIVFWTFSRPTVKDFFGETNEQPREN
jgi:hypothetical protein